MYETHNLEWRIMTQARAAKQLKLEGTNFEIIMQELYVILQTLDRNCPIDWM